MSATMICRVLQTRPESDWDIVFAEELAKRDHRDAVLKALEPSDENLVGVEPVMG